MHYTRANVLTRLFLIASMAPAIGVFAQSPPASATGSEQSSGDQPQSKPGPFSKMFSDIKSKVSSDLGLGTSAKSGGLPVEIEHLFLKTPYDTNRTLDTQYPRVAVTVVSAPPNHSAHFSATSIANAKGCWKLTATVWLSKSNSKSLAPFDACMPGLIAAPTTTQSPLDPYERWWLYASMNPLPSSATTGQDRSDGPKPPESIFPTGIQYSRYFHSGGAEAIPERDSFDSWFWCAVLYHLDFDPMKRSDRRFWIVKMLPVAN